MAKEMKIIWVSNILLPAACRAIGIEETVKGGWMLAYRNALKNHHPEIKLFIVSLYNGNTFRKIETEGDIYYAFPENSSETERAQFFKKINIEIQPDVVHIHGSEYPHSLLFLQQSDANRCVLSIQGLVSVCYRYYLGGITNSTVTRFTTLRDILKRETLFLNKKSFKDNGKKETAIIQKINNVIGRTSWDRTHVTSIHRDIEYFFCNEALRDSFYQKEWSIQDCQRHSIFISQVHTPLKGFHQLLKALPTVMSKYPDTEVFIVGEDLSLKPWYKQRTYWKYLKSIIDKYNLRSRLHFLGNLSEQEMANRFQSAHVFVCPSSIENSSNSVCEAQLIGTPVVASYVGGMMDLISDNFTGMLYRFEETEMLADKICQLFANDKLCQMLSTNERLMAQKRHDRKKIADTLYNIYSDITTKQK